MLRRRMTRATARASPRPCRRSRASAGKSPVPPGKSREPAPQSRARPEKSRAPREKSQAWLCRVPRSAGKESRSGEREPGSDEKKPCEALWSVERGSPCPALGMESVTVGTARSWAWRFETEAVPDTFSSYPPAQCVTQQSGEGVISDSIVSPAAIWRVSISTVMPIPVLWRHVREQIQLIWRRGIPN